MRPPDTRTAAPAIAALLEYEDAAQRAVPEQPTCEGEVTAPGEARILADHLVQETPRETQGRVAEGEKPPCRLLGVDRAPPLLDELDEPVSRVEPELHGCQPKRTYVRWQGVATPWRLHTETSVMVGGDPGPANPALKPFRTNG